MRWIFLVGGITGILIAVIRQVKGGNGAYPAIFSDVSDPTAMAGLLITWHALTVAFLLVSGGMIYAAFSTPPVARICGIAGAVLFGATSLLFLIMSVRQFGSPFVLWPWALLLVPSLCGAVGAWRV